MDKNPLKDTMQPAKSHGLSRIYNIHRDLHLATRTGARQNPPPLPCPPSPVLRRRKKTTFLSLFFLLLSIPLSQNKHDESVRLRGGEEKRRFRLTRTVERVESSRVERSCPVPEPEPELAADPRSERGRPAAHRLFLRSAGETRGGWSARSATRLRASAR